MARYLAGQWCDTDPEAPGDVCDYVGMFDMSLIETFLSWDLHYDECGKQIVLYDNTGDPVGTEENCQAISACVFWSSEQATIAGMSAGDEESER
jgi:hypothetical protein